MPPVGLSDMIWVSCKEPSWVFVVHFMRWRRNAAMPSTMNYVNCIKINVFLSIIILYPSLTKQFNPSMYPA
jgi:hypothetical protein